jgi:signal transduction histidine kinase
LPESTATAALQTSIGYVEQSLTATRKLEEMINELLNKSRKDASLTKTSIDLNDILRSELNFLQANMALKHKIKQTVSLAENMPAVFGVHSDFSQIFCNLIQNAADAMKNSTEKELTIVSQFDDEKIIFEFMDSGPGIAADIQDKIFEPFFSTKGMKDDVAEGEPFGTGLGLFTCAEIIRAYNGNISVRNRSRGGACFTVTVPYSSLPEIREQ